MKNIEFILLFIFLLALPLIAKAQEYEQIIVFDIVLYQNDTFQLNQLRLDNGTTNIDNLLGNGYEIAMLNDAQQIIFAKNFTIEFGGHGITPSGAPIEINFDQKRLTFRLPVIQNAKYLELLHNSKTILQINLQSNQNTTALFPPSTGTQTQLPWIYVEIFLFIVSFVGIIYLFRRKYTIQI